MGGSTASPTSCEHHSCHSSLETRRSLSQWWSPWFKAALNADIGWYGWDAQSSAAGADPCGRVELCTNKSSSTEDWRSWSTGVASKPAPFSCTDRTRGDDIALAATPLLLPVFNGCRNTPLRVSLPPTECTTPPPLHRHEESLFTGTICPINVRSQQTVLPLISLLDLNEGRSLTNCCLETQQDASIMGFIQKPARPSSHPSCPFCAASELQLQIGRRIFSHLLLRSCPSCQRRVLYPSGVVSLFLVSCSNFAYLLDLTQQIVLAAIDSVTSVWFIFFCPLFLLPVSADAWAPMAFRGGIRSRSSEACLM